MQKGAGRSNCTWAHIAMPTRVGSGNLEQIRALIQSVTGAKSELSVDTWIASNKRMHYRKWFCIARIPWTITHSRQPLGISRMERSRERSSSGADGGFWIRKKGSSGSSIPFLMPDCYLDLLGW